MPKLIIDTKNNVLVNLPSGKIKKNGNRTTMNRQNGVSCFLSSLRKLSFFTDDFTKTEVYKGLKKLKKELENSLEDIDQSLAIAERIFEDLNVSLSDVVQGRSHYVNWKQLLPYVSVEQYWNNLPKKTRFFVLYEHLREQAYPSLNIGKSLWEPSRGVNELMDELRQHGALLVVGKFGPCFHGGMEGCVLLEELDTEGRQIHGFAPNTYTGEESEWSHTVIIDQIKLVNGIYRVFFRDPHFASKPDQSEKVFMISYHTFIKRLSSLNPKSTLGSDDSYLLFSVDSNRIINAPLEPVKNNFSFYLKTAGLYGLVMMGCFLLSYHRDNSGGNQMGGLRF